jgi:hypothetical protein
MLVAPEPRPAHPAAAARSRPAPPQLFVGDTNRTISETPMNQASSRSHCIFTLHLEARPAGGDTVRRSKLHLVDLAGSERVSVPLGCGCGCGCRAAACASCPG